MFRVYVGELKVKQTRVFVKWAYDAMQATRRGKFRAFLKPTSSVVNDGYDENSFTSSQDDEISVEVTVGPRGLPFICLPAVKAETV